MVRKAGEGLLLRHHEGSSRRFVSPGEPAEAGAHRAQRARAERAPAAGTGECAQPLPPRVHGRTPHGHSCCLCKEPSLWHCSREENCTQFRSPSEKHR